MKTMDFENLSLVSGGFRLNIAREVFTSVVVDGIVRNGTEAITRTIDRERERTQERREGQDCQLTRRGTRCS